MSFFGATGTPVLDFWWRLLWVSKPEWVLPYSHCRGKHNVRSLRSTSWRPMLSPHTVAEVRLPGVELVLSEYLWARRCTNWAKPGPTWSHISQLCHKSLTSCFSSASLNLQFGWFEALSSTIPTGWTHVVMNYIGPSNGQGIRLFFDGKKLRDLQHSKAAHTNLETGG